MENEEWDLLPGPVYVKSFLRPTGISSGSTAGCWSMSSSGATSAPTTRISGPWLPPRAIAIVGPVGPVGPAGSARVLSPRSVIVVALVVIVVALYVIGSHNGGKNPTGGGNPITPATTTTGSGHHTGTGTTARTTTTGTTSSTTTTTPAVPKNATLSLVPTATVWICVENQAGTPLMTAADYSPGQTIPTLHSRAGCW